MSLVPVYTGTLGWTDATLIKCGRFYPASARTSADKLKHYSQFFSCIEIDTTNYAIPRLRHVLDWVNAVPDGFLFHVKIYGPICSRTVSPPTIPSDLRKFLTPEQDKQSFVPLNQLNPELVQLLWDRFIEVVSILYEHKKLGAVVFQFHASFIPSQDNLDYLISCRERLPAKYPMAVELRNRNWFSPELSSLRMPFPTALPAPHPLLFVTLSTLRELGILHSPADDLASEWPDSEVMQPYLTDGRIGIADLCTGAEGVYIRIHRRAGPCRMLRQSEVRDWAQRMQMLANGCGKHEKGEGLAWLYPPSVPKSQAKPTQVPSVILVTGTQDSAIKTQPSTPRQQQQGNLSVAMKSQSIEPPSTQSQGYSSQGFKPVVKRMELPPALQASLQSSLHASSQTSITQPRQHWSIPPSLGTDLQYFRNAMLAHFPPIIPKRVFLMVNTAYETQFVENSELLWKELQSTAHAVVNTGITPENLYSTSEACDGQDTTRGKRDDARISETLFDKETWYLGVDSALTEQWLAHVQDGTLVSAPATAPAGDAPTSGGAASSISRAAISRALGPIPMPRALVPNRAERGGVKEQSDTNGTASGPAEEGTEGSAGNVQRGELAKLPNIAYPLPWRQIIKTINRATGIRSFFHKAKPAASAKTSRIDDIETEVPKDLPCSSPVTSSAAPSSPTAVSPTNLPRIPASATQPPTTMRTPMRSPSATAASGTPTNPPTNPYLQSATAAAAKATPPRTASRTPTRTPKRTPGRTQTPSRVPVTDAPVSPQSRAMTSWLRSNTAPTSHSHSHSHSQTSDSDTKHYPGKEHENDQENIEYEGEIVSPTFSQGLSQQEWSASQDYRPELEGITYATSQGSVFVPFHPAIGSDSAPIVASSTSSEVALGTKRKKSNDTSAAIGDEDVEELPKMIIESMHEVEDVEDVEDITREIEFVTEEDDAVVVIGDEDVSRRDVPIQEINRKRPLPSSSPSKSQKQDKYRFSNANNGSLLQYFRRS